MERNEINQDSIKSVDAWKDFKSGYMNRGNKTPEENQAEYDREKNEFYFNKEKGTLRLIPTDDGEVQDRSGIEKWQLAPDRMSSGKGKSNRIDNRIERIEKRFRRKTIRKGFSLE